MTIKNNDLYTNKDTEFEPIWERPSNRDVDSVEASADFDDKRKGAGTKHDSKDGVQRIGGETKSEMISEYGTEKNGIRKAADMSEEHYNVKRMKVLKKTDVDDEACAYVDPSRLALNESKGVGVVSMAPSQVPTLAGARRASSAASDKSDAPITEPLTP